MAENNRAQPAPPVTAQELLNRLGEIRVHLACENLPGAHRTQVPLDLVNEAIDWLERIEKEKQS